VASEEKQTTTAVTLRRGRLPLVFVAFGLVIAASVGLLFFQLTGGVGGIDRSDPRVVIREFIQAAVVDRNAPRAQSFMCDQWKAADAIQELRYSDNPQLVITWGVDSLSQTDNSAVADVEVHFRIDQAQDVQHWRVQLVKQSDGWRVCSAANDPSLAPK
jgi:hypothetical protein